MPAFLNPARSSRHRTACFALYKALLRQVPKIKLPDDLASHPWQVTPIKYHIRKSFRRNVNDTSQRLVVAALRNGYNALSLLSKATDPSTPAYSEVISFIRTRPLPPAEPWVPPPKTERPPPLLTLDPMSEPDHPVYFPTVRPLPLSKLSGDRRRVPVLVTESRGYPFLRIGKPQSPRLSMILKAISQRRDDRTKRIQEMEEDEMPLAQMEDQWERLLRKLAEREGQSEEMVEDNFGTGEYRDSYLNSVRTGLRDAQEQLTVEKRDMLARGDALLSIVDEETELAERENANREQAEKIELRQERAEARQTKRDDRQTRNEERQGGGEALWRIVDQVIGLAERENAGRENAGRKSAQRKNTEMNESMPEMDETRQRIKEERRKRKQEKKMKKAEKQKRKEERQAARGHGTQAGTER